MALGDYMRDAWRVLEPATRYVHNWHIDYIAEYLSAAMRGEIRNLIINIPPRHMKSLTVCVFWPTWAWTYAPHLRWLFASYALPLAIRDSLKCRRLIRSPWYQERWSGVFALAGDQNVKSRFENDKTGYRLAIGVGGGATGEGGDVIVVDDPLKAQDAHSDAVRESANTWWDQVMSTRANDESTVVRVVIMQRLHQRDLTGHIQATMEQIGATQYETLILPAEYEPNRYVSSIGLDDPRTKPGELLWPERFPPESIDALKVSLGSMGTAGQLQQRPTAAEGGILKRHWWRFWRPRDLTELPPVHMELTNGEVVEQVAVPLPAPLDMVIQSWDMAFKDLDTSSYVVGQVWGRHRADKFLLDQDRAHRDMPGTLRAVRDLTAAWPQSQAKYVEDKANGPAVISTLKHEISGLIEVSPGGSKAARGHAVAHEVEAGNVYLPHPFIAPWVYGLIDECADAPNGAFDDQYDALTQALRKLAATGQLETTSSPLAGYRG